MLELEIDVVQLRKELADVRREIKKRGTKLSVKKGEAEIIVAMKEIAKLMMSVTKAREDHDLNGAMMRTKNIELELLSERWETLDRYLVPMKKRQAGVNMKLPFFRWSCAITDNEI